YGDTLWLTADSTAFLYEWNTDDGSVAGVAITQPGSYFAWVENALGCGLSSDTVEISFSTPPVSPTVSDTVVCPGSSLYLFANSTENISWFNDSLLLIGTGDSILISGLYATTQWYVQATDSFGCPSIFDTVLIDMGNLVLGPVAGNLMYCVNEDIALYTNSSGYAIEWTFNNNSVSQSDSLYIPSADTTHSGWYVVTLYSGSCSSAGDSVYVGVSPHPQGAFITGDTAYCENDSIALMVTPNANYSFTWNYPGGNFTGDTLILAPANISNSGIYSLFVTNNSCTDTITCSVTVNLSPVSAISGVRFVCEGDSLVLQNVNPGAGTFTWSGPDGQNLGSAYNLIISAVDSTWEGYYYLTSVTTQQCSTTDSFFVDVFDLPFFELGNDTIICAGSSFTLTGPPNYYYYQWSNGSNSQTTQVTDSGYISLTVVAPGGCHYSDSLFVEDIECTSPLANVFTPNGDGTNDFWMVQAEGIKDFHCTIYNRWGILMREWSNNPESWDGTNMQGEPVAEDVYYYVIEFTNYFSNREQYHGFVHLIR
ncbi:MAG: gliding motility-associated C-terminal domain-containing protein, partial [Flavobacteriales bacterium]